MMDEQDIYSLEVEEEDLKGFLENTNECIYSDLHKLAEIDEELEDAEYKGDYFLTIHDLSGNLYRNCKLFKKYSLKRAEIAKQKNEEMMKEVIAEIKEEE